MSFLLLITSGTGRTEVRDFVGLLAGRIEQLCADLGSVVLNRSYVPNVVGPRSVTLRLQGTCPDRLSRLAGTHALVTNSRQRAQNRRSRWFAAVRLVEDAPTPAHFRPDQLVVTACRAGGPGGQNVNNRSTAVWAMDPESGVAVKVSEQRLQSSNRRLAKERIEAKLQARRSAELKDHEKALRASHYQVIRGNPVCTWCLNAQGQLQEVI